MQHNAAISFVSVPVMCGLHTHPLADADPHIFLDPQTDSGSYFLGRQFILLTAKRDRKL